MERERGSTRWKGTHSCATGVTPPQFNKYNTITNINMNTNNNKNNTLKALHDGNAPTAVQQLGLYSTEKQLSHAKTLKKLERTLEDISHWKFKSRTSLVETATTDSCGSDGGSHPGETSVYNFHPATCNFQVYFHICFKGITQCFFADLYAVSV